MIEENQTFCWRGGSSWDAIRRMKVEKPIHCECMAPNQ
jgi:hypothetical protein